MDLDIRLTKEKESEGQSKKQDVDSGAATSFMQGKGLVSTVPRCMADVETRPINFPYACLSARAAYDTSAVQLSSINLSLTSSRNSHQWAGESGRGLLGHVYTVVLAELGSKSPSLSSLAECGRTEKCSHHVLPAKGCLISGCCRSVPCDSKTRRAASFST